MDLIRSIKLTPIASIITDARANDNPIIAVNKQFELLTGYSEVELIGRNCRVLVGSDTERVQSAALSQAIAAETPHFVELINYRKDGSKFMNAVMVAPIFGTDGHAAYFVGSQMAIGPQGSAAARDFAKERINDLTAQQRNVLRFMASGLRNRQIGEKLGLTEKTIKMHRSALVKRLGVASAVEALRLAIQAGY
jgi:PAS domain S-box-containing protein